MDKLHGVTPFNGNPSYRVVAVEVPLQLAYAGEMPDSNSRFTIIDGGNRPIAGARKKRKSDAVMCLCRTCEADTGVASSVWVKAKLGLMERDGKTEGGTDAYVCAMCLGRGKITRLT